MTASNPITREHLAERRERARREWEALWASDRTICLVNVDSGSAPVGAREVLARLREEVARRGLGERVVVRQAAAFGTNWRDPTIDVRHPGAPRVIYGPVPPERVPEFVDRVIVRADPAPEWAFAHHGRGTPPPPARLAGAPPVGDVTPEAGWPAAKGEPPSADPWHGIPSLVGHQWWQFQQRIVMEHCGWIDPDSLDDYLARGGFLAFERALFELEPTAIVEAVKASGLRGRGGAGFPTGTKWESAVRERNQPKYIIINAHEGEPNAFKDRRLMEGDPLTEIEGLMIGAKTIGTKFGYIFIGSEHPIAIERMSRAVQQLRESGLLGENILGSGFDFDIKVLVGAGAYISGESGALMYGIQGERSMPRTKPPRSVEYGVWGKPTVLNNCESFAAVPFILLQGPEAYAAIGPEKSRGTKMFSLNGQVEWLGVVEVPLGITMRNLLDTYGGMIGARPFKGMLTGGVSGGVLIPDDLDAPMTVDKWGEGGMLGSGASTAIDDTVCIVEFARYLMRFNADQSCGKCVPCRHGCEALFEIIDRITKGGGRPEDTDLVLTAGDFIIEHSLCGLGTAAPEPIKWIIKNFRAEWDAHVLDKRCPCGTCPMTSAETPRPTALPTRPDTAAAD